MTTGNIVEGEVTILHSAATPLFPLDQLEATIYRYRDAELKYERTNASQIVAVGPTSVASSYFLAQHPLTLVELDTLSSTQRDELRAGTELDIDEFEFIQIGRNRIRPQNYSLNEY